MTDEYSLLQIKEVARLLFISDESVYRLVRAGKIRAIRIGGLWRVSREAVDEFLAEAEYRVD